MALICLRESRPSSDRHPSQMIPFLGALWRQTISLESLGKEIVGFVSRATALQLENNCRTENFMDFCFSFHDSVDENFGPMQSPKFNPKLERLYSRLFTAVYKVHCLKVQPSYATLFQCPHLSALFFIPITQPFINYM